MEECCEATQVVQFENLPKCEFENHYERCPSGRRICKFYDAPCGVENPAKCVVLQKVNKDMALAKVRAINLAQTDGQQHTKKRRVKNAEKGQQIPASF